MFEESFSLAFAKLLTESTTAVATTSSTTAKSTATLSASTFPTSLILGLIVIIAVGGILGTLYSNSYNTLFEMETLITFANEQYENKLYESSFDTFSKVDQIFLSTVFSPDHVEYAEYLHLQSLTGMGNSLQSQSDYGQIKSFSEKSEEYYLHALTLYDGKHNTENAWIGRGINAIYETPEKTLEYCSLFDSVNSHMCQGEAYVYLYVIGKASLDKAEEQFEKALDMAGSENQRSNVQYNIDQIYKYYKLPIE